MSLFGRAGVEAEGETERKRDERIEANCEAVSLGVRSEILGHENGWKNAFFRRQCDER
jgi:hypothetical protein